MNFLKISLLFLLFLSGCNNCQKSNKDKDIIKLGVIAGLETELMEKAKEVAKKEYGLNIELVVFNDYMTPNIALNDGSIDANAFQHEAYLKNTIKNQGFKIKSAGKTFIYPLAAYSKKIKNINELKNGAKIAIPNDPSNEGRSLILLDKVGLIKLKDNTNTLSNLSDIIENKLNLKIIELDAAQLPRALDDVFVALINTTFAKIIGLNPKRDGLFMEDANSPYVNIVAVREQDINAIWLKKLMNAIQNDQVVKVAEDLFLGCAIPGWK